MLNESTTGENLKAYILFIKNIYFIYVQNSDITERSILSLVLYLRFCHAFVTRFCQHFCHANSHVTFIHTKTRRLRNLLFFGFSPIILILLPNYPKPLHIYVLQDLLLMLKFQDRYERKIFISNFENIDSFMLKYLIKK